MSQLDTPTEAPVAVANDAFIAVNYQDRIPNNVDLASDRQLQRALESWQPKYLDCSLELTKMP
jgi:benzoyl-CoA 2,3-dioxygenase component B